MEAQRGGRGPARQRDTEENSRGTERQTPRKEEQGKEGKKEGGEKERERPKRQRLRKMWNDRHGERRMAKTDTSQNEKLGKAGRRHFPPQIPLLI